MTREEQNQAAGLPEGFEHKGAPLPAYRPIRARLLLQVEDREPVEVFAFEPAEETDAEALANGIPLWRCARVGVQHLGSVFRLRDLIDTALTVEVRELLAEQRKHEDPTEGR